jgi:hypothetical protein
MAKRSARRGLAAAVAAGALATGAIGQPPAPEQAGRRGLEGEALGYLAVPVLLVLTLGAGLLVGGEEPDSP